MTATPDLIERLAAEAQPVRRLPPPWRRTAAWLALAMGLIAVLALLHGPRPDLAARIAQPSFCLGVAASLLTGALAALAAFTASLPDRTRLWLLLPLPAAALWVGSIGYGCLTDWVRLDTSGMHPGETARCFLTLLLSSVPLSLLMFRMLRHAGRLRPRGPVLCGAGAVAALTATALAVLHEFDASAMVLLWQFGTAALVLAADAAIGRRTVG
jgi:hypothetical protein